MRKFTVDDYVDALWKVQFFPYKSDTWLEAVNKADSIMETLLEQEETADEATVMIADDIMTMSMEGMAHDDPEVIRLVGLLEKAGAQKALAKVKELEWVK